ncbi:MAG TPA: hypothetical protein QF446_03685 [Planctomycetota bacterium]|nr:hypothetical protein [Planctomycetota bacterium]
MRLLSTPLLALCATTLLSSPLQGQPPAKQDGRQRVTILERLDTNGDGDISAEETQAGLKAFQDRGGFQALPERMRNAIIERLDKDGDGKVSEEEGQAGRKALADGGRFRRNPSDQGSKQGRRPDGRGEGAEQGNRRPDGKGKRPDGRGKDAEQGDRRPDGKGKRPDGRGKDAEQGDRRPDGKGKRPDGRGEGAEQGNRRPDGKGKRPDGQSSGLGHLARFDTNGDCVIDAEEAQSARALIQRFRGQNGSRKNSDGPRVFPESNQRRPVRDSGPGSKGPDGPGARGPQRDAGQRGNARGEGDPQRRDARGRGPGQDASRGRPSPQDMRRRIQSMRDRSGQEGDGGRPQRRR